LPSTDTRSFCWAEKSPSLIAWSQYGVRSAATPVATRSLSCWPFHQVKNTGTLLLAIEVCMNAWYLSVGVMSWSLMVVPEAWLAASASLVMPASQGVLSE
jgi:hypothetical protein